MKAVIITLALVGLVSTAPLDAQILGSRPIPTTTRGSVNGSWQVVGRDGNGNTIYERRTTDRYGNVVVQRARRDVNGNMSIISTRTETNASNRNGTNCNYSQSTNSVGDIIFGRSGNVNCDDVGNRVDGGWYQVGQGRDNNSIYTRRTRDANGNLVIQRARRNPNGTFTILSTRYANDSDKEWKKANKDYNKAVKRSEKENRKGSKGYQKNDRDDNRSNDAYNRGDDRYYAGSNAVARGNGHGKDNDKGKHKDKDKD